MYFVQTLAVAQEVPQTWSETLASQISTFSNGVE